MMISLAERIESSIEIQKISKEIKAGYGNFLITGALGSLAALLVNIFINKTSSPHIIITPDNAELEKFAEDFLYYSSFSSTKNILKFPGPEIFIGDKISFDDDSKKMRLETLSNLYQDINQIIITTKEALESNIPDMDKLINLNMLLNIGRELAPLKLAEALISGGYIEENIVDRKGTFSRRGGILDVFPIGEEHPVRVEFSEEEIASLRLFDLETQRSVKKINEIEIHPYEEPAGEKKLKDCLPDKTTVFFYKPELIDEEKKYSDEDIKKLVNTRLLIEINAHSLIKQKKNVKYFPLITEPITSFKSHIDTFILELKRLKNKEIALFILCNNKGQKERLIEILEENEVDLSGVSFQIGNISAGFAFPDGSIAIIKDDEIFGRYEVKKKYPRFRSKKKRQCKFISGIA
ncbi:hypothetical protein HZA55_09925 [Candidatus Poribacteria bacterium]|nr:hypothetical protein [Candidatus Poribacteria bacterium]